ncbi:hypothetical protein RHSIM_Rhsim09G0128100 [Rhododendron simsii]|uniref:ubiquitinyl hydrolase 1 n=1 Tax=Rhododendron simsii TaxID=118357 RepID=A0A834GIJ4_RHOSS|nr:hypothetical protein RHSIM_Rhsim09G0128100 [Rhododendron simsii]
MQNQDGLLADAEVEGISSTQASNVDDWENFRDDAIMQQQSSIWAEEAEKIPFVGDKAREPLSSLAAEYQSGSPILLEKIKLLTEEFAAIRRTRGDGNCFFRSFMFSYLERILESQDQEEVHRITGNVENCRRTLQSLGYADFTFEDFFALFLEQLESVLQGNKESISHDELIQRSRDQSVSDYSEWHITHVSTYVTWMRKEDVKHMKFLCAAFLSASPYNVSCLVVMFFRFVTSGEIRKRSEFFEPFILGLTNATVEQFCKSSVEPMGEESDHVHITALSDALGVPIRVVYLDRSSCDAGGVSVNHHDFIPNPPSGGDLPLAAATATAAGGSGGSETIKPFITLLYRPGHYDILYPK